MPTYTQIGTTITVGSGGASSVTFSSIPSTYTDLKILASARNNAASTVNVLQLTFNGSTSNFTGREVNGSGTAVGSSSVSRWGGLVNGNNTTATTFASTDLYIPNYGSSTFKSFSVDTVTENNGSEAYAYLIAGLWSETSAITEITLNSSSGNLSQYSTFALYGISNA
jgi:hypothetical protein